MPISYLDNQNQDMYSLKRLGSVFSDAVVGAAEARAKRQQFIQQNMLEQQYLALAREKEQREAASSQVRNALEQAQTQREGLGTTVMQQGADRQAMIARLQGQRQLGGNIMDIVKDPQSGPQLMGDLRSAGVAPQGQFQMTQQDLMQRIAAAVKGQVFGEATSSAAGARDMSLPFGGRPEEIGRDPQDPSSIVYQNPPGPISPYQAQMIQNQKDWHAQLGKQFVEMLSEKQGHNTATEEQGQEKIDQGQEKLDTSDILGLRNVIQGKGGAQAQPSSKVPSVGEVRKGYKFKGGDPSKKENWEQVNE